MEQGRRFELLRELGSGAFGTVYLAHMVSSRDFRKRVAIKLLNAQWDASGDAGRRLRDEARLLGLLRHRSIVTVDDLVMLDGRWAVVMEHVPGADLERVLEMMWKEGKSVPLPAALEVVSAVASALDAAFNGTLEGGEPLRVVHRDIKPSNIRLTPDGDIKVLDFGIARADFHGREARTEEVRYGSLGYMAPERVLGEPEGPEGDVYALGCVLVELLRGKALGRSALLPDQQVAQVKGALDEIRERLGPDCEQAMELISETLRYEIHERPSALEVAERARRLAKSFPGEDLAEFSRHAVPRVALVLGDTSREARGQLTETPAFGNNDTSTQSILVEGSSFDRTAELARRSGPVPEAAPPEAPVGMSRTLMISIGVGALLMLLILVPALLRSSPQAVNPPADEPALSSEPARAPEASAATAATAPAASTAVATTAPPPEAVTAPAASPAASAASAPDPSTSKRSRTSSGSSATTTPPVATAPPTVTVAAGPPLRALKFTVADASSVEASCGGVSGRGSTSALLRDVPAGPCSVSAVISGASYTARVVATAPTGFTCTLQGGALGCQ